MNNYRGVYFLVKRSFNRHSDSNDYSIIGEYATIELASDVAFANNFGAIYGDILMVVHADNIHELLDKSEAAYFIDKDGRSIKVSNKDNNLLKLWDGSDADANTMLGKASECMDDKIITLAAIACARTAMLRITDKRAYAVADKALSATADYCAGIGNKVKAMKAAEVFLAHYKENYGQRYLLPISSAISINFNAKNSFAYNTPFHLSTIESPHYPDYSILSGLSHTVRSVIPANEFFEAMWEKATERLIK